MQFFFPTIAILPDMLFSALSVIAAIVISFVGITFIASYYRFQHIIQMAKGTNPADMGATETDILRVQLARYFAGCARRGTSFSISLIHFGDSAVAVRMDSPVVDAVRRATRCDDTICIYDEQTVALLTEIESDDVISILSRITSAVAQACPEVSIEALRVGIASYPGHGLSSKNLLGVVREGLAQANAENPILLPEIVNVDEDEEEHEQSDVSVEETGSRGWKERRRSTMLDELTGVLKPSAVSSYMQRLMSDLRHKKKAVSLFCIGINNIDHITRFYGEEGADDVLVGVSQILQKNLRADDLIGRHEKYAFLVLAPISLKNAEVIGKRISALVQQSNFVSGNKKIKTTITLGVSAYPEHGRNLHQLYQAGQKVLDYSRLHDIRAYAIYNPEIHDSMSTKPMKSIKSVKA